MFGSNAVDETIDNLVICLSLLSFPKRENSANVSTFHPRYIRDRTKCNDYPRHIQGHRSCPSNGRDYSNLVDSS